MTRCWLLKTEPSECSIDDVLARPDRTVDWWGIRNYQARNFLRDGMRPGDRVLFYHSSCPQPGIAGLATVVSAAYPDPTQFDPKSPYYDPRSTREAPRWVTVDVRADRKIALIPLSELRAHPELSGMRILARGNRLSVTPVTEAEYQFITEHLAPRA